MLGTIMTYATVIQAVRGVHRKCLYRSTAISVDLNTVLVFVSSCLFLGLFVCVDVGWDLLVEKVCEGIGGQVCGALR